MAGGLVVLPPRKHWAESLNEGLSPYLQFAFQQMMAKQTAEQQYQQNLKRAQQLQPELFQKTAQVPTPQGQQQVAYSPAMGKIPTSLRFMQNKAQPGQEFNAMTGELSYKAPSTVPYMGIYTTSPEGALTQTGIVPRGAKVLTPSQLQTPQGKVEMEAQKTALKETQVNLSKVKRLTPIVDTIEKEWIKTNPQSGLSGRLQGLSRLGIAQAQTDKNLSAYRTFVKGMRAQLARAMGDVGNLSEPEQKAAMDLVPTLTDNIETGMEKISKVRAFIATLEQGNQEAARSILGGFSNQMQPQQNGINQTSSGIKYKIER